MQDIIGLKQEYEKIWNWVLTGKNFALIRNGDGERSLMEGARFEAQEGWQTGKVMTGLGQALLKSIRVDDPNYWIGISCPCCDPEAYKWYLKNIPGKQITLANLWVNSNYPAFVAAISNLERDAVIIANHRAMGKKIGKLNILDYFCVSDDCVSFWEEEAPEMIEQIIRKYGKRENLLFVVSAGPMSGPIIEKLYRNNPHNCYLDFGSSIDSFYWEIETRPYMNPEMVYARRHCWMYNPEGNRRRQIWQAGKLSGKRKFRRNMRAIKAAIPILPQLAVRKILGDNAVESIKKKIKR